MTILLMSAYTAAEGKSGLTECLRTWSEQQLVAAAKTGHAAAFGELCDRHAAKMLRVAHRITRNREDAEDAVQDSLLSAFLHVKDFDERARFATWLTRIAINAALAKLRKKRTIREVAMDEPNPSGDFGDGYEVTDSTPNPEEAYHLQERRATVSNAINKLRPRSRKVVEFHQLQEYSIKETAKILGISVAAAKARMFHARSALRRTLRPRNEERTRLASAS